MKTLQGFDGGYEIRELTWQEFEPLWDPHAKRLFDDEHFGYRWQPLATPEQSEKTKSLRTLLNGRLDYCLGLFHEGEFVGWSYGFQESAETFYMMNSAILEEHRRKGWYTLLAKRMITHATEAGFQKIYSRHLAGNNSILIAKLKMGFRLTTFEMTDTMGLLVHLTHFPLKTRERVMDFRTGTIRPDQELKTLFKLE